MVVSTHWGCPLTGQDFTHGEQGIHSLWTLRRHSEVLFVARQVSQEMYIPECGEVVSSSAAGANYAILVTWMLARPGLWVLFTAAAGGWGLVRTPCEYPRAQRGFREYMRNSRYGVGSHCNTEGWLCSGLYPGPPQNSQAPLFNTSRAVVRKWGAYPNLTAITGGNYHPLKVH